jgi:large subunit ribosomal protein L21
MYAVVNTGGKQYKVQQGEVLRVEKIAGEIGTPVKFDRVLMFSDGENVSIGQPVLEDVAVEGHIVEQGKAKKIIVFKYKRRKRYRRKQGHRQAYTAVQVDRIATTTAAEAEETPAQTAEPQPEAITSETEPQAQDIKVEEAAPKKDTGNNTEDQKGSAKEMESEESSTSKIE